jgi:hypothetical protein
MKALFIVLTFCNIRCFGQGEEAAVQKTINQFFDGLRTSDSVVIKATLAPAAILQTIKQKEGKTEVFSENMDAFITAVTKPYKFYIGEKFSHCGVNSFQLVKLDGNWKIQFIIDTRRKQPCN